MGAALRTEVAAHAEELIQALQLKPLEAPRLRAALSAWVSSSSSQEHIEEDAEPMADEEEDPFDHGGGLDRAD